MRYPRPGLHRQRQATESREAPASSRCRSSSLRIGPSMWHQPQRWTTRSSRKPPLSSPSSSAGARRSVWRAATKTSKPSTWAPVPPACSRPRGTTGSTCSCARPGLHPDLHRMAHCLSRLADVEIDVLLPW